MRRERGTYGRALMVAALGVILVCAAAPAGADEPPTPTVAPEPTVSATAAPSPTATIEPVPPAPPSSTATIEPAPPSPPASDDASDLSPTADAGAPTDAPAVAIGGRGALEETAARSRAAVSAVDNAFRPMELTVTVGDEVVWTNLGLNPHTVTADDGSFDSGTLGTRETFSVTFDRVGEVPYHCQIHGAPGSGMFGIVVVQAAVEEEGEPAGSPTSAADALAATGAAGAIALALWALGLAIVGLASLVIGRRAGGRR